MYFWSVAHDRPRCWAVDRENYHGPFRPRRLPSRSQFGRRLHAPRVQALRDAVTRACRKEQICPGLFFLDGRALPIGPYGQDRDAGKGKVGNRFAKGYKMHALTAESGFVVDLQVTPLNVSEKVVAKELIAAAKPTGLLLADGNYDAGYLYDLAFAHGAMLFTPMPKNAGRGHRPQSPARLRAVQRWKEGGDSWYRQRTTVERQFSAHSSFGGGLQPLPAWVRGLDRVTQWVNAKLTIYHVRLSLRENVA